MCIAAKKLGESDRRSPRGEIPFFIAKKGHPIDRTLTYVVVCIRLQLPRHRGAEVERFRLLRHAFFIDSTKSRVRSLYDVPFDDKPANARSTTIYAKRKTRNHLEEKGDHEASSTILNLRRQSLHHSLLKIELLTIIIM